MGAVNLLSCNVSIHYVLPEGYHSLDQYGRGPGLAVGPGGVLDGLPGGKTVQTYPKGSIPLILS